MFKKHDQMQRFLQPFNLEEFVPENHIARVREYLMEYLRAKPNTEE